MQQEQKDPESRNGTMSQGTSAECPLILVIYRLQGNGAWLLVCYLIPPFRDWWCRDPTMYEKEQRYEECSNVTTH